MTETRRPPATRRGCWKPPGRTGPISHCRHGCPAKTHQRRLLALGPGIAEPLAGYREVRQVS
jgi:hypothetical protein